MPCHAGMSIAIGNDVRIHTSYICGNSFPQCMCVTSVKYISPTGMQAVHKMFYLNFDIESFPILNPVIPPTETYEPHPIYCDETERYRLIVNYLL